MAIGIRILSNDLSGVTANVTFLPTSGGTIDLGSQTIPFNYLTSNPFGVYELYVPLYDYTYEVMINQGVSGQSFSFISKLTGRNNNGAATLNFNDFTAQIIDLDVDYTGWDCQDIYPLTNSGYAYYFQNNNTCNLQWVIFTDAFGNILESFQTNCNCEYTYDNLAGKWVTFEDFYNGIIKYSNGQNVYTWTGDPATQMYGIYTDGDGVTMNGNIVLVVYDSNTTLATNYLINENNQFTEFSSYDYTLYTNNWIFSYFDGDFISELKETNSGYESLTFYNDTDGALLQGLDLTGDVYNDYNLRYYGDNKIGGIFFNDGDINVPYLIFQYDGNTNTLVSTGHARGTHYQNYNLFSNRNLFPNPGGSDSLFLKLYHIVDGNNLGYIVDYCDFIYMLSGDTSLTTYVFQDSGTGDKTIRYWPDISDIITNPCDNGDGFISNLVITSSGVTITPTDILTNDGGNVDTRTVGNGFVSLIFTDNGHTGCTLVYINNSGEISDTISGIEFTSGNQYRSDSFGSLYQFTNYMGGDYFINEMSDMFQMGNTLTMSGNTGIYYTQPKFRPDFILTGVIFNIDNNTRNCNILSSTGYTDTFTLPEYQYWDAVIGDDKFMFTFIDLSGNVNINLYDFNFNLLNSLVTEHTSFNSLEACGNSFVQIINENNKYYIYLVSESTISSSILTDDNDYYTFNDYVWWD